MTTGIYSVEFIHPKTGETVAVLDSQRWRTLHYVRELNGIGEYSLTFDATDTLAQYANTKDLIAEIRRRPIRSSAWVVEDTFLTRLFDDFQDENDINIMIFGGFNLNHFLARHVVRPEDDPNQTPNSIKGGTADSVMQSLVDEQFVNPFTAAGAARIIPGLSVAPINNVGDFVFQELNNDNILEVLKGWAVKGRVDFQIRRDIGLNYIFYAENIGNVRTVAAGLAQADFVLFDPKRGNMQQPRLTRDSRQEKTVAFVMGQGPEEDREVLRVLGDTWLDSPYNWIEGVTDSRSTEIGVFEGLQTAGLDYLRENQEVVTFDFEPDLQATGGIYKEDWDLGDTVSASYKGNDFTFRINAVTINIDANGESIDITLQQLSNVT